MLVDSRIPSCRQLLSVILLHLVILVDYFLSVIHLCGSQYLVINRAGSLLLGFLDVLLVMFFLIIVIL